MSAVGSFPGSGGMYNNNNNNNNNNNTNDEFRIPQRNPLLESFVNDASGNFQDPSTALAAAESRCVGLVASAESFAQQRHSKLQQLFKKIHHANTEEVYDLSGRVSICESALQELSSLLEQLQLHIGSASSSTQEFMRTCTIERGKSEGRLLSTINSMLMQYEQHRRTWRRAAAQHCIRQDLQGVGGDLNQIIELLDDDDDDTQEETSVNMGFLGLEEGALKKMQDKNSKENGNDDDIHNNNNNNSNNNSPTSKQVRKYKRKTLIQYMPEMIREKRKTMLQRFSQMLGQMLIDGDSVDRPFLLDATYARLIRYSDILTVHGETICRLVAEMFHVENEKRKYYLLDNERKIFAQQAVALCPPNLVEITNEPIYTTFVYQIVQNRLEREVSILQMMDKGLENQKEQCQKVLDQLAKKFDDGLRTILNSITKHGVKTATYQQQGDDLNSNNNADGSTPATPPNTRYGRQRSSGVSFAAVIPTSSNGGGGGGGGGGSTSAAGGGSGFTGSSLGSGMNYLGSGAGSINEANVAAIVSKLLSASFGELADPDSTDEKIRKQETQAMQRVIHRLLHEVAATLEETYIRMSTAFNETIAAVQPSPINLINNQTIFSLDSLNAELSHQALLLKVASTNEGTERSRLIEQLKQERLRSSQLQHDMDEKSRQAIVLQAALQSKEAEVTEFDAAFKVKQKTQLNIRNEIRKINYVMTSEAFGKGWQESVLLLRETMLRQLHTEQARLLTRVKAYQKRKFDDQNRVVELLETGFVATQEQIEADNISKLRELETRHKVEMQRVRDECTMRVRNAHLDAQSEIKKSREMFEKMYFERINELNDSYDEKVRQVEQRQKDWEDRLWSKMKQIRQDFRDKEVATEKSYAEKHEAVMKIYDMEATTLKKNIIEKEALLESERLSVHLETERKINEGINKVKGNCETVRSKLQDTMLHYLAHQRQLFEQQRQAELELFSEFAFGGMQHAKDTAFGIVEANRKNFQKQVEDSQKSVQEASLSSNEVTTRLLKHRDDLHDKRLINIRSNNEQVLRKTQLVRIEQDEKTWNQIHKEIVKKSGELDQKQADVEQLMAQRYIDIVKTLHQYIQGDVTAAHQTFERECHFRQDQLRRYLNHFHLVSLKIEAELWRETSARSDLERESFSLLNLLKSRSRAEAEYVMRNSVIQSHVATLNENAEETTFTTVEGLRGRYEALLRRQHQLMGAMSHDYVSSLQHYVSQQNASSEALGQIFASRMDELRIAMRSRWELHWASRDMLVERRMEEIVVVAARGCKEVLGGLLLASPSSSSPRNNNNNNNNNNSRKRGLSKNNNNNNNNNNSGNNLDDNDEIIELDPSTNLNYGNNNTNINPPLFYVQDVRVVEYFTKIRELLSKTFEDLDEKITAGLQERELKQRHHAIETRAKFLDAAAALTRRAEQLEDKVLDVKMENNTLHAQLQLKSESEIRAAILADDLKALVSQYRSLTQNAMIHGAFGGAGGNNNSNNNDEQPSWVTPGMPGSALTSTGMFKRQHLLQGKNTNVSYLGQSNLQQQQQQQTASSGMKKNESGNDQKVFHATFLLDVGGKRATRDVVAENAMLRERLMANEWKNDRFLREALISAHQQAK